MDDKKKSPPKEKVVSSQVLEYYRTHSQDDKLSKYFCGSFDLQNINPPVLPDDNFDHNLTIDEDKIDSPTSSIILNRKLEWDNGADIGYNNCSKTLHKSSSLPVLTNLDENKGIVDESNVSKAKSESTESLDLNEDVLKFLYEKLGVPTAQSTPNYPKSILKKTEFLTKEIKDYVKKSDKINKVSVNLKVDDDLLVKAGTSTQADENLNLNKEISTQTGYKSATCSKLTKDDVQEIKKLLKEVANKSPVILGKHENKSCSSSGSKNSSSTKSSIKISSTESSSNYDKIASSSHSSSNLETTSKPLTSSQSSNDENPRIVIHDNQFTKFLRDLSSNSSKSSNENVVKLGKIKNKSKSGKTKVNLNTSSFCYEIKSGESINKPEVIKIKSTSFPCLSSEMMKPKVGLRKLFQTKPVCVECIEKCNKTNKITQTTSEFVSIGVQTGDYNKKIKDNTNIFYISHDDKDKSCACSSDSELKISNSNSFEYLYNPVDLPNKENRPVNLKRSTLKEDLSVLSDKSTSDNSLSKLLHKPPIEVEKKLKLLQKLFKSKNYNEETKNYYLKKLLKEILRNNCDDSSDVSEKITPKLEPKLPSKKFVAENLIDDKLQGNVPWVPVINDERFEKLGNCSSVDSKKSNYSQKSSSSGVLKNVQTNDYQSKRSSGSSDEICDCNKSSSESSKKENHQNINHLKNTDKSCDTNCDEIVINNSPIDHKQKFYYKDDFCGKSQKSDYTDHSKSDRTKSWRDDKTISEKIYENKIYKCKALDCDDDLVTYAKKERNHQLNWINNEINHLEKLKKLLTKNDTTSESDKETSNKRTAIYMITTERVKGKDPKDKPDINVINHDELSSKDYKVTEIITKIPATPNAGTKNKSPTLSGGTYATISDFKEIDELPVKKFDKICCTGASLERNKNARSEVKKREDYNKIESPVERTCFCNKDDYFRRDLNDKQTYCNCNLPNQGVSSSNQSPLHEVNGCNQVPLHGISRSSNQAPLPGVSHSNQAALHGVSRSNQVPLHGVSHSTQAPLPGVSSSNQAPLHGVICSNQAPLHGVSHSNQAPLHGISRSNQVPLHGVSVSHSIQPPLHGGSRSNQSPLHGVSRSNQSSLPKKCSGRSSRSPSPSIQYNRSAHTKKKSHKSCCYKIITPCGTIIEPPKKCTKSSESTSSSSQVTPNLKKNKQKNTPKRLQKTSKVSSVVKSKGKQMNFWNKPGKNEVKSESSSNSCYKPEVLSMELENAVVVSHGVANSMINPNDCVRRLIIEMPIKSMGNNGVDNGLEESDCKRNEKPKNIKSIAYSLSFQTADSNGRISKQKFTISKEVVKKANQEKKLVDARNNDADDLREINKTLQEYLSINHPNFIKAANERRKQMSELAQMREKKCQRLIYDRPKLGEKSRKHNRKRLFTSKEMKNMATRKYRKLPEVQEKVYEHRKKQFYEANRYLAALFKQKLKETVLKGTTDLSTSVSVINMKLK